TGLDLTCVGGNGDVSNGGVLGFAGAVRGDGGVTGALGQGDGVERFGQGADLVDLDQQGVRRGGVDALLQALGVGDEEVVAHELDLVADCVGEGLPAFPA